MILSTLTVYRMYPSEVQAKADPDVNVGIAFCGNTTAEAKLLIDRTKDYTNLFVLDSGGNPISHNRTQIEEICDYAVAADLKIIINTGTIYIDSWFWKSSIGDVLQSWRQRWGDKFLGIYYNDEIGGIQLDGDWTSWFKNYSSALGKVDLPAINALNEIYAKMQAYQVNGTEPQDYDKETAFFIDNVINDEGAGLPLLKEAGVQIFTADYCLYWFDYLGGYDTMFAELGWNHSTAQQISLVKGAARLQHKSWGTIITWKYDQAPYLDSGKEVYNQMLTSFQAGAEYIILFNYPILSDYGAMKNEHFIALKQFWNDITRKNFEDLSKPQAVLVLPPNYGSGLRSPMDNIWGFWPADEKTFVVWDAMDKLLTRYGASLDIVYEDPAYPVANGGYEAVYYWNQTI
jgi:hypothetical protein